MCVLFVFFLCGDWLCVVVCLYSKCFLWFDFYSYSQASCYLVPTHLEVLPKHILRVMFIGGGVWNCLSYVCLGYWLCWV